ncbi:MAG: tRNA-dihydrouridine synthase family protein [Nanoarchaeota archaeon]|nr:tRNA-dihydrouridine synthase family protein [Nanoarchaeota archaeon]
MMQPLKIGNLKLKNPLLLAPMVDVTDLPYRLVCRKQGAAMAYTEMLNLGAIIHENKKTQNMMKTSKEDRPLGIQVTGNSVEDMKKAVPYFKNYDLVDINCGCPSDRIIGNSSGSHLLKTPEKIKSFISCLKNEGCIVTAKIRLGFKKNNVVEIAKEIEKAGADALTIHARLASESYNVPADWKWIADIKNKIGIPVIGNGDINSGQKARQMLDIADGAMIARAAIGDPTIFKQILYYLKTGKEKQSTLKERIQSFREYIKIAKNYDLVEIPRIKRLGCHFIKGQEGSARMRGELMSLQTLEEIEQFVRKI